MHERSSINNPNQEANPHSQPASKQATTAATRTPAFQEHPQVRPEIDCIRETLEKLQKAIQTGKGTEKTTETGRGDREDDRDRTRGQRRHALRSRAQRQDRGPEQTSFFRLPSVSTLIVLSMSCGVPHQPTRERDRTRLRAGAVNREKQRREGGKWRRKGRQAVVIGPFSLPPSSLYHVDHPLGSPSGLR